MSVYSAEQLENLSLHLSMIEDWLREGCSARHADDMAEVVHEVVQVIDDLAGKDSGKDVKLVGTEVERSTFRRPSMSNDPTADVIEQTIEICARLAERIRQVDEEAGSTIEKLATLVAEIADSVRVLSDRVSMLELDRQNPRG